MCCTVSLLDMNRKSEIVKNGCKQRKSTSDNQQNKKLGKHNNKEKKYNDVAEYKSWEVLIFSIPAAEC